MVDPTVPCIEGFWQFVQVRMKAWHLKQIGQKSPDPVLASGHYPNVMRELDPGTQYFHDALQGCDRGEALSRSIMYRLINRLSTFEEFGGIPWLCDIENWEGYLFACSNNMKTIFTGRHQTRGMEQYFLTLNYLKGEYWAKTWDRGMWFYLPLIGSDPIRAHQMWERLQNDVPGVAKFFAWQICCDMIEAGHLNPMTYLGDEWAYMGPGPQNALQMIIGFRVKQKQALDLGRQLVRMQPKLQDPPPERFPQKLSLKNVEHALCEYYRYTRAWQKHAG